MGGNEVVRQLNCLNCFVSLFLFVAPVNFNPTNKDTSNVGTFAIDLVHKD